MAETGGLDVTGGSSVGMPEEELVESDLSMGKEESVLSCLSEISGKILDGGACLFLVWLQLRKLLVKSMKMMMKRHGSMPWRRGK